MKFMRRTMGLLHPRKNYAISEFNVDPVEKK